MLLQTEMSDAPSPYKTQPFSMILRPGMVEIADFAENQLKCVFTLKYVVLVKS